MEFVMKDSLFGKISDFSYLGSSFLEEFLDRYVKNHVNKSWLLFELSNIYVLIAMKSSNDITKEDEKKWVDIMEKDEYKYLDENRYYILGYILVKGESKVNKNNHYIDFIDTRLRRHNIAKYMIGKYEKDILNDEGFLLPHEIIESSANYWKKYFSSLDIECLEELDKFIKDENIKYDNIKWEYLKENLPETLA